jgi:hypothetical protein
METPKSGYGVLGFHAIERISVLVAGVWRSGERGLR